MVGSLIGFYVLIVSWILSFIYLFRKKITPMVGMMAAMVVGMVLGLSFGVILMAIHLDHFFEITIISMLFGAFFGALAGLPISIMAVLDGLLAGAMGGMMGTMVAFMVSAHQLNPLINIMIVLSGGAVFILFLLLQSETHQENSSGWKLFFFNRPLPLFIIILLTFFMTFQFDFPVNSDSIPNNEIHLHE